MKLVIDITAGAQTGNPRSEPNMPKAKATDKYPSKIGNPSRKPLKKVSFVCFFTIVKQSSVFIVLAQAIHPSASFIIALFSYLFNNKRKIIECHQSDIAVDHTLLFFLITVSTRLYTTFKRK